MKQKIVLVLICLCLGASLSAQNIRSYSRMEKEWFGSEESLIVAENILLLQKDNGGWEKNYKSYGTVLDELSKSKAIAARKDITESTIDNGASTGEINFLASMYQATGDTRYLDSFRKGIAFLYTLQYPNGGFKQFARFNGYYTHITYNDNAMVNVLLILDGISKDNAPYSGMSSQEEMLKAKRSFDMGIECILNTQYVQNGKLTVWCAQHDENTLLPAKARAYELPSLSGAESVGILKLLMSIKNPGSRIIECVNGAMDWFEQNRITDIRIESFTNADGKPDRRMVKSSEGKDIWGRFCDLTDNRPFVCDRDGIKKYDISEIGYERRNGYGWFTDDPNDLFPRYAKWKKR